jgi:5-methylcytosine-specific restriction endonuclease McrA
VSNTNVRGSAADRRARKVWLFATFGVDGIVTCYRCAVPLLPEDATSDRIVPGARGGTYARANLRPACHPCQDEQGWMLSRGYE